MAFKHCIHHNLIAVRMMGWGVVWWGGGVVILYKCHCGAWDWLAVCLLWGGGVADGHCVVSECSLHGNRQKRVILYEPCTVMIWLARCSECCRQYQRDRHYEDRRCSCRGTFRVCVRKERAPSIYFKPLSSFFFFFSLSKFMPINNGQHSGWWLRIASTPEVLWKT